MNHECDPNAVLHGVNVIAWRSIVPGEDTLDYRLNAVDGASWRCECRSPSCGGIVDGGFFGMEIDRQRALLAHAGEFVRREYRRRR